MANLLSIGQSGLLAAQAGLSTTGHNITNANVEGYSRQVVIQKGAPGQDLGNGFIGGGTEVVQVKRYYDNFLASQVRSAQSTTSSLDAFAAQISQIDNVLADPAAGLSPALQDFFNGVQDVAANPASAASRQALLSSAGSLASRFQGLSARMTEIGDGVNAEITTSVDSINSYAQQIGRLNDAIAKLGASETNPPNDMLDQRDQLVNEMNKLVKTTVTPGDNNSVTVSIGSGQPLVVGKRTFELAATNSLTEPGQVAVGYVTGSKVTVLAESALSGGTLGGLMEFRSGTLERVQNSLGRIAIGLASTFNAQHQLGQDMSGNPGEAFFKVAPPIITSNIYNNPTSTTAVSAVVSDVTQLTASDYSLKFDGTNFAVTRQSDGKKTTITSVPQTIDGVDFTVTGSAAQGDSFTIKPTVNGASGFGVLLADRSKIAAAAPVRVANVPVSNTGTGKISDVGVDKNYPATPLPVTLTYVASGLSGNLTGFPAGQTVTVTTSSGAVATYPPVTLPLNVSVPYNAGDKISFGGISVVFGGTPADLDTFSIEKNNGGVGDNRNAALLGKLQTSHILEGGTATFQGVYAEAVSFVGNKTREAQVNGLASASLLAQSEKAQQDVSGVNLDEEAANLLRYQQAYQAAGKVMQIASSLFDVLLSLGR